MGIFKEIKEKSELQKENEELKLEIERLKANAEYYNSLLYQCERMKDELLHALFEAKKARSNYLTLYKELSKLKEEN